MSDTGRLKEGKGIHFMGYSPLTTGGDNLCTQMQEPRDSCKSLAVLLFSHEVVIHRIGLTVKIFISYTYKAKDKLKDNTICVSYFKFFGNKVCSVPFPSHRLENLDLSPALYIFFS